MLNVILNPQSGEPINLDSEAAVKLLGKYMSILNSTDNLNFDQHGGLVKSKKKPQSSKKDKKDKKDKKNKKRKVNLKLLTIEGDANEKCKNNLKENSLNEDSLIKPNYIFENDECIFYKGTPLTKKEFLSQGSYGKVYRISSKDKKYTIVLKDYYRNDDQEILIVKYLQEKR